MCLRRILLICLVFLFTVLSLFPQYGRPEQFFAQLAMGQGSVTAFSIHNPNSEAINVSILLVGSDGSTITEVGTDIPALGTETLQFGNPQEELTVGWARLASKLPFVATEFFQIQLLDQTLPRVGVLPGVPATRHRMFGFIKSGETNTGLALANPDEKDAVEVAVRRYDTEGSLAGEASFVLPPRGHLARFLDEEPLFKGLKDYEGMVEIESELPIVTVMLRSDNSLLSAASVESPRLEGLEPGAITTELLAPGAVTGDKIAEGTVVRSLNGLTEELNLVAGENVTVTESGNQITIAAESGGAGGGSGDITAVLAGDGLAGGGLSGEVVLTVAEGGITAGNLAGNAVTNAKIADNTVGSAKIIDGSVGPDDLADGAVTDDKLAAGGRLPFQVLTWIDGLQWRDPSITEMGWQYSCFSTSVTLAPGEWTGGQCSCSSGRTVISGGGAAGDTDIVVQSSYPGLNETWNVTFRSVKSTSTTANIWINILCARIN
jgi:hypothetical protein